MWDAAGKTGGVTVYPRVVGWLVCTEGEERGRAIVYISGH